MNNTDKKSEYLEVIPENIPGELKARNQWVVWRAENRSGKPGKIPYNSASGAPAKVNDPSTWTDFETAVNLLSENNAYDGIGYVLSAEDPFVGVDLDHCVEPDTGKLSTEVQDIVDRFGTYTEISPSGTGIRIFTIADLPEGRRKKDDAEIYDSGHYLTLTGHRLSGTPEMINDSRVEVRKWYKKYFIRGAKKKNDQKTHFKDLPTITQFHLNKAFKSKNGQKIKKLFYGDSAGYNSPSEADQALCNYLAFWVSRNPDEIDKAFRCSGLYRQKWDEKHYADGKTYSEKTIENAIQTLADGNLERTTPQETTQYADDHSSLNIVTIGELLKTEFKEQKSAIIDGGILPHGGGMILAGESGVGKSLITLEWAIMMAKGSNFYENRMVVTQPCKIVFFQLENTPWEVKTRLQKMSDRVPLDRVLKSIFVPKNRGTQLDLLEPQCRTFIVDELKKLQANVFIIDPLTSFHHRDENNNVQMQSVLNSVTKISHQTGAAAIVVHHFGKTTETRTSAYKVRGASSINAWADTLITLERRTKTANTMILMRFDKVRNGPEPPPILLERDPNTLLHTVSEAEGFKVTAEDVVNILDVKFGGNVDIKKILLGAIVEECDCSERTATEAVKRAKKKGLISEEREGRNTIVRVIR